MGDGDMRIEDNDEWLWWRRQHRRRRHQQRYAEVLEAPRAMLCVWSWRMTMVRERQIGKGDRLFRVAVAAVDQQHRRERTVYGDHASRRHVAELERVEVGVDSLMVDRIAITFDATFDNGAVMAVIGAKPRMMQLMQTRHSQRAQHPRAQPNVCRPATANQLLCSIQAHSASSVSMQVSTSGLDQSRSLTTK